MGAELNVEIVRFIDASFPGFVECRFTDADGGHHALIDKILMLTKKDLWIDSEYPQPGQARCQVLSRSKNAKGEDLVRITIASPDGLETTDGLTEFIVPLSEISIS